MISILLTQTRLLCKSQRINIEKSRSWNLSETIFNNHQACLSIFHRKIFSTSWTSKLDSRPVIQTSFMENMLLRARQLLIDILSWFDIL